MKTVFCIVICLSVTVAMTQKSTAYLELGGMGGVASLNYEWQLFNTPLRLRAGTGITLFGYTKDAPDDELPGCALCGIDIPAPETVALTIPVSLQYLIDMENNNFLETGFGGSWQLSDGVKYPLYATIGFRRYFGNDDSWMWKANFTPLVGVVGENAVKDNEPTVWGGLSIGKRF